MTPERVAPFLVALLVTPLAALGIRWLMVRMGVIDIPNSRSSHTRPTPRGGGLACVVGVLASGVAAEAMGLEVPWSLIGAAFALSLVGFADDSHGLGALSRLAAQGAAGACMGWAVGGGWLMVFGAGIALVVVNSVNFMDGINGMTSLSVAVWGVTAWLVGLAAGVGDLWVLGAAAAGAALGFLPWNAPSARLFLGDAGSYLFGALISAGILMGFANHASPLVLAAPLAIYLADTGTVILMRVHRGGPVLTAHREHAYQLMVRHPGVPHLLVSGLVAALAAIITTAVSTTPIWMAVPLAVVISAAYVVLPRIAARRETTDLHSAGAGG